MKNEEEYIKSLMKQINEYEGKIRALAILEDKYLIGRLENMDNYQEWSKYQNFLHENWEELREVLHKLEQACTAYASYVKKESKKDHNTEDLEWMITYLKNKIVRYQELLRHQNELCNYLAITVYNQETAWLQNMFRPEMARVHSEYLVNLRGQWKAAKEEAERLEGEIKVFEKEKEEQEEQLSSLYW